MSPPAATGWLPLVLLLALSSGCTAYHYAAAGVTTSSSSNPGRTGVAVDLGTGTSLPGSDLRSSPIVLAAALRGKFTKNVQQLAPALGIDIVPDTGDFPLVPLGGLGFQPLHFERADRAFGFGMGSPLAHLGLFIGLSGLRMREQASTRIERGILLLAAAEYNIRFTSQPSEPYFSLSIGYCDFLRVR